MKPILQALVMAERVYEDKANKKIICGTFNRLLIGVINLTEVELPDGRKGHAFPGGTDMGCPSAYISLTDIVGKTKLTLQFLNVSKNVVLFEIFAEIACLDRLATAELVVPLPPISTFCKEAGIYSLDVLYEGEILGSHRLTVESVTPPTEGK